MELKDWLAIVATVLSPFFAVYAQRRIDIAREKRVRRAWLFHNLMATRAAKVSPQHVEALNMIDLTFCTETMTGKLVRRGDDLVVHTKWKEYRDHLNTRAGNDTEDAISRWGERGDELFVELLFAMSRALGYSFDKVELRRSIYSPVAHGERDQDELTMRRGLAALLDGKISLPVSVASLPVSAEDAARAKELQLSLKRVLDGTQSLSVKQEGSKADEIKR